MTHQQPTAGTDPQLPQPTVPEAIATTLGRIPSGLYVVTWRESDRDRGMLASWVMQAGFQPPAITLAVASGRGLLSVLDDRTPFVVNVLGESQRPLMARFGRPAGAGDDPFAGVPIVRSTSGAAAFSESVGWLECRSTSRADAGDHVVVVALVVGAGVGTGAEPLVHLRRNGLRY